MSEKGFSLPLHSSRYLLSYSILFHGLAGFAVISIAMPMPATLLLLLLLVISLLRHSYLLGFVDNSGCCVTMLLHR